MNGKKSWALVVFLMTCLGLLCATNALPQERGVTKDTIKIGMILVKTGPVAALGLPDGWGIQDAFTEANEQGGINGRKIESHLGR